MPPPKSYKHIMQQYGPLETHSSTQKLKSLGIMIGDNINKVNKVVLEFGEKINLIKICFTKGSDGMKSCDSFNNKV